jgi:hypothetical protein
MLERKQKILSSEMFWSHLVDNDCPSCMAMGVRGSFPGVKRPGRDADHSPPSSSEVKECVELYLHSSTTPSWRGSQLKHRNNFTFTFTFVHGIDYIIFRTYLEWSETRRCFITSDFEIYFRVWHQEGARKSRRIGTEWKTSACGLCWWC